MAIFVSLAGRPAKLVTSSIFARISHMIHQNGVEFGADSKSDEDFAEWCKKLLSKHHCLLEKEKVGIQLKERSNLKLTYKDLDVLKKLV